MPRWIGDLEALASRVLAAEVDNPSLRELD